jgi:hypothetical protein
VVALELACRCTGGGELPETAGRRSDVIDAAVVLIAHDGDDISTPDPEDLRPLAAASARHVELTGPRRRRCRKTAGAR